MLQVDGLSLLILLYVQLTECLFVYRMSTSSLSSKGREALLPESFGIKWINCLPWVPRQPRPHCSSAISYGVLWASVFIFWESWDDVGFHVIIWALNVLELQRSRLFTFVDRTCLLRHVSRRNQAPRAAVEGLGVSLPRDRWFLRPMIILHLNHALYNRE